MLTYVSGSVEKVLSGKHYNRAMQVHKLVLEALERLFLEAFTNSIDETLVKKAKETVKHVLEKPDPDKL